MCRLLFFGPAPQFSNKHVINKSGDASHNQPTTLPIQPQFYFSFPTFARISSNSLHPGFIFAKIATSGSGEGRNWFVDERNKRLLPFVILSAWRIIICIFCSKSDEGNSTEKSQENSSPYDCGSEVALRTLSCVYLYIHRLRQNKFAPWIFRLIFRTFHWFFDIFHCFIDPQLVLEHLLA